MTTASPTGKRRVTFHNKVQFREICHINDYTEHDVEQIWYSYEEYQLFKAVCKVTVKMMVKHGMQSTEESDPDLCCRGLVRTEYAPITFLGWNSLLLENIGLTPFVPFHFFAQPHRKTRRRTEPGYGNERSCRSGMPC